METKTFTLKNKNGLKSDIITFGARQVTLFVPDRNGKLIDVITGFDDISQYKEKNPYFGAVIGRCANRIANGKIAINGIEYQLACNLDSNHLHGGNIGFDSVEWQCVEIKENDNGASLTLSYFSKDGEENYPGNLKAFVTYSLTNNDELIIEYKATTDKKTICNLTQHNYYNLSGYDSGDILDHELKINADYFTPMNDQMIPTGEIKSVENTNFDFRTPIQIGERINNKDEQLVYGNGYDHNFVLNKESDKKELSFAASVFDRKSGIVMEVFTEEPGMQFYTGNFLDGTLNGKNGVAYEFRSALCLETQHFPDSIHHPNFPSIILEPEKEYSTKTIYKFTTK